MDEIFTSKECFGEVFMEFFKDKRGREINIDIDDLDVVAHHGGVKVGDLCFREVDCGKGFSYIQLTDMNVAVAYQKAGIATEMMRAAVAFHGNFSRPLLSAVGGGKVAAEDYYTGEGAAFISYCIEQEILPPDVDEEPETDERDV